MESTDPNNIVPLNYEWMPAGMDLTVLKVPDNKVPKSLGANPKKDKVVSD